VLREEISVKLEIRIHLWHVVHRPFSYAFALLASIHIPIVLLLGYL
jgi:hypothetical protein